MVRAAFHDILTGDRRGRTWLKKQPHKHRAQGKTMDELGFVRPSQAQVAAVIELMRTQWVSKAKSWWTKRKQADTSLSRWDAAMEKLMFRSPSTLDVESLLCEQGNRQRHVVARHGTEAE